MSSKVISVIVGIIAVSVIVGGAIFNKYRTALMTPAPAASSIPAQVNPLSIQALRNRTYPGSNITIEQTLAPGSNYQRYIASYQSDGLKIYALFTVPIGSPPAGGWPVVIFNHGYIPPKIYRTTERYIAYTDAFSRNGYIVIRPDYRGNGDSQGQPSGAYGSNDYTIDVLNAVSSIKKYTLANPNEIGMWGHSMGGFITLRALVVTHDIKAASIWGGVVASYPDLFTKWHPRSTPPPEYTASRPNGQRSWRGYLTATYGSPDKNPAFWNSISANSYLPDITTPIQLQHSLTDEEVPVIFSETLADELKAAKKYVELYTYPGDDHNISGHVSIALQRSVEFFNTFVKGGEKS